MSRTARCLLDHCLLVASLLVVACGGDAGGGDTSDLATGPGAEDLGGVMPPGDGAAGGGGDLASSGRDGGVDGGGASPCVPNPCVAEHQTVCQAVDGKAVCSCDPGFMFEAGRCVPLSCTPGAGTDYPVGPGQKYGKLADVPWRKLAAGDTVRIHHQAQPYREKFMISGRGTREKPIRVCGVKGPNGERPIISGVNAVAVGAPWFAQGSGSVILEPMSLVLITTAPGDPVNNPTHIIVEGLEITGQYPTYNFTSTSGRVMPYEKFGACVYVDRGEGITLRDNVIHDCSNGLFTMSKDYEAYLVTRDILVQGNDFYDFGVINEWFDHGAYTQSIGTTFEFNRFSRPRDGRKFLGSCITDRSARLVVRYNRFEDGARALDLVEAQDWTKYALADPGYHVAHVYGNIITAAGEDGVPIHFGGDHFGANPGDNWGEGTFRKGPLYFYNNTVVLRGGGWSLGILDIPTTETRAEVWNNVFYFSGAPSNMLFLSSWAEGLTPGLKHGGTTRLGVNWINDGWKDKDPNMNQGHMADAVISGQNNMLTGKGAPVDPMTFAPGAAVIGKAQPPPQAVADHPVDYQYVPDLRSAKRASAKNLGALE